MGPTKTIPATIEDILNNNDVVESMMSYAVIEDRIVTVT